jgi:hypothetical protein
MQGIQRIPFPPKGLVNPPKGGGSLSGRDPTGRIVNSEDLFRRDPQPSLEKTTFRKYYTSVFDEQINLHLNSPSVVFAGWPLS